MNPPDLTASSPALRQPNYIHIMRDAFPPEKLETLIGWLSGENYQCEVFDNSDKGRLALCDARASLILLGAADGNLAPVAELVRLCRGAHEVPLVVYLKEPPTRPEDEVLLQEVDDFLTEPLGRHDARLRIQRLVQRHNEKHDELRRGRQKLISYFGMRQFIGSAPAFVETIKKIPLVAACDAVVLLTGATGTGKEMCARAIHYLSPQAQKPFIPVNCGSIPADLFENEMFGHESGAYTDARQPRRGLIAEAEGGTLFLDEIDSLPLSTQVKLLRFLQDKQFKPLGASQSRQAHVRLIAASNKDLLARVKEGAFREDLYYRLRVVTLSLATLRERQEDILPLSLHFLETAAKEYGRPATHFAQDAVQKLNAYEWPGNVRELENVVRHAVILSSAPVIRARDIQLPTDAPQVASSPRESLKAAKTRVVESFERSYLQDILAHCGGNISEAARQAQKDRRTFFALLKKYRLNTAYQRP
jgi:two-component system, NtrC family, response regulator GlrR